MPAKFVKITIALSPARVINMTAYQIWDFKDVRDRNVISEWAKLLTKQDQAKLNQKIKRLSQMDFDLAKDTKLLAGPIYKHVYKLVIHGNIMLRPLLCRGPINNEREYTLLLPAVEVSWKLPPGAVEQAEENREIVISDPNRRVPHVIS